MYDEPRSPIRIWPIVVSLILAIAILAAVILVIVNNHLSG